MQKLKVGVIGMGMGRTHILHFKAVPDVEVAAVADLELERRRRAQKEYGVPRTYANYRTMLRRRDLDIIVVAAPNHLHCPMTIEALEAKKHVLCEKPMAMNVKEAERMADACRRAGKKFMVHYNQRFRASSLHVKKLVDSGALGTIYHVRTGWTRRWGVPGRPWFSTKAESGGGPLIDLGVHMLDLALWFMGFPKPSSVFGATWNTFGPELSKETGRVFDVEDQATAIIRFQNGAALNLDVSWASHTAYRDNIYLELLGTMAGVRICTNDHVKDSVTIFRRDGNCFVDIAPIATAASGISAQSHFADAIRNDTQPWGSVEEGVAVIRILEAIYASAERGCAVSL